ncbi:hypothetical protein TNCT_150841 [Trichonephila clavata]|uniref:Uncharacterized protein n=1 Tax=Trichonephila clavata TaxID=2740835 RepID=A0A8X6H1H1_TRICU|nr:hypothetical protein TNCT_150841 [Trichonephila clavata]
MRCVTNEFTDRMRKSERKIRSLENSFPISGRGKWFWDSCLMIKVKMKESEPIRSLFFSKNQLQSSRLAFGLSAHNILPTVGEKRTQPIG